MNPYPQDGSAPRDEPVASGRPFETTDPADPAELSEPAEPTRDDLISAERSAAEMTPVSGRPRSSEEENGSLLGEGFAEDLRRRWHDVQADFVDDPYETVRRAGQLTEEAVGRLTGSLTERKSELDDRWNDDKDDTEELRQALKGYRVLLDRVLSL
ncbi:hypothetical protein GCM10027589_55240 [Actinocorallia lasiicapitis]